MRNKIAFLFIFVMSSCGKIIGYSVEQEVRQMHDYTESVATYVWHNGKIIQAWYDPVDNITKDIVLLRQRQADTLISALKSMK